MPSSNEPKLTKQQGGLGWLVWVVSIGLILCLAAPLVWFGSYLDLSASERPSDWGVYGDFTGGVANPLVSLAALFLLYRAYSLQRKELSETSTALIATQKAQTRHAELARRSAIIHAEAAKLEALSSKRQVAATVLSATPKGAGQRVSLLKEIDQLNTLEETVLSKLDSQLDSLADQDDTRGATI